MSEQDWKPVVWKKKKPTNVNDAASRGYSIGVQKKNTFVTNKADKTEIDTLPKITKKQATTITNGRLSKKWTQKQLAAEMNEKIEVISKYENGKAIVNNQILQKFRRVLGIKL